VHEVTGDGHGLRVGVLGPLVLEVDGSPVEVPGTRRRAVLALLAVGAPDPVGTDRLVDGVWPSEPPASGRTALQSHVSRLRRHLGPYGNRLASTGAGYRLDLRAGELDAARFDELARGARDRAADDPSTACSVLREAVSLWRSSPLAELSAVEPLAAWARATTDAWLAACDLLAECSLRCRVAGAAERSAIGALAEDPLRESTVLLLMRALAEQGRTAHALRAGNELRVRMREQTGLDPSPALADLEQELAARSEAPAGPQIPKRSASVPAGGLVGREAELAGLRRLLASDRLVTIVGPGGVGKTRLATELAHRAAGGTDVTVVGLAAVTDPTAVPDVLARALGVEAGSGDPLERCVVRLRTHPHLLVLDNCEHVLGIVRDVVATLLARCARLTVLATSRERLALDSEQTSPLAPLPMPSEHDRDHIGAVPSVALFLDRARRARAGFAPDDAELARIARIVRALDGLPLAIELAAGRLSSLGVEDLERRLDRALDLLGGGGGAAVDRQGRHRTLRAAVQWSYDLLPADEQRLFRHLAAFPGGFDLATAEEVASGLAGSADPATMLAHLVDSSMVVAELDGAPRYRMLDTLRSFALDQLAATGEMDDARATLLRLSVALAAELDAAYETEDEARSDRRLRVELANLRAAWRLARDIGDLDAAATLAVSLYSHASWRELTELFRWSLELSDDPGLVGHPSEAQVLGVAAEAAWSSTGDLERAETLAERAVAAVRPGDELGYALANWARADVHLLLGRYREGAELAIAARTGTRWEAEGYAQAAIAAAYEGDLARAQEMATEARARTGGPTLRAYVRYVEGEAANLGGQLDAAKAAYRDAIEGAQRVGASFIVGIASVGLVTAQAAAGDVAAALAGYRRLLDLWERTGAWTQQWTTLRNLATLLDQLGDAASAEELRAAADRAPEAASVAGTVRAPQDPALDPAANRAGALARAREAITQAERTVRSR
jgi:predicted ATPase/DNA-binding SARP family transcriptional activator